MAINKVILIGNLGADPEVKYLDGNRVVANFNIATNESYTDKQGNKVTQTEWHRIEMWDGLAKVAEKYLSKGRQVYIEGKLKTDHYTDKEGIERYSTRIRATTMQLLGSARDESDEDAGSTAVKSADNGNDARNQTSDFPPISKDDDLPF
ncbi:MAG: single-strand DNA-binding protein [Bacteroidia bacterium]|jgi:single-strand DNA-binding protein